MIHLNVFSSYIEILSVTKLLERFQHGEGVFGQSVRGPANLEPIYYRKLKF